MTEPDRSGLNTGYEPGPRHATSSNGTRAPYRLPQGCTVRTEYDEVLQTVLDVNPALAQEFVFHPARCHPNRKVSQAAVNDYARSMENHTFYFTGESLKFNCEGRLVDGQQRLRAVIQTGMTVRFPVCFGLPLNAQDYMDQGKRRSNGDVLAIHGHKHATIVAAAVKLLVGAERGTLGPRSNGFRQTLDSNEVLAYVRRHPDVDVCAEALAAGRRLVVPSVYLAAYTLLYRADPDEAPVFDAAFRTGAGLQAHDPVLALRTRLIQASQNKEKVTQYELLSALLRCWNHWRRGAPLTKFVLSSKGASVPIPEGLE